MLEDVDDITAATTSHEGNSYMARSANLRADPKMRELKRYRGKLQEDNEADVTLRRPASSGTIGIAADMCAKRPSTVGATGLSANGLHIASLSRGENLRSEGREAIDRHLKRLAQQQADPPHKGPVYKQLPAAIRGTDEADKAAASPTPVAPLGESFTEVISRLDRGPAKTHMRGKMDRMLQRMMVDLELAQDERLNKYGHQVRCGHLDKMYGWYQQHKMKDVAPGPAGPPYVKFRSDAFVMPGSMRVAPLTWHTGAALGHSSSSPSLTVGGTEDSTLKTRGRSG